MATGTLRDLLASGMSPEEINALLSQSNVSTAGYDPMGTTGRGEPYMPPPEMPGRPGVVEQAPLNMIRNNSTGRTFAPTDMYGQPSQSAAAGPVTDPTRGYVDTPAGRGMYMKADPTRVVIQGTGQIVDLGRDTGAERARMKENLALDAQRANIAHTQAQTAAVGAKPDTTPIGYRKTATGGLEAIPGGPADVKAGQQYATDTAQFAGATSSLDRLASAANEALQHPGLPGVAGLRGAIWNIPGSDAANAAADLQTLKTKVAFDVLQEMRNNSKTGGALGQVSDMEQKMLQSALGNLDKSQSIDQLKKNLAGIIDYTQRAKDRYAQAYALKHGPGALGNPSTVPTAPSVGGGAPTMPAAPASVLVPAANEQQALTLPPGTRFRLPDGRTGTAR